MAELPELRSDRLPERAPGPQPLFGRPPSFGVSHDLERMKQGSLPARTAWVPRRTARQYDGAWARLRRWWASGDTRPADVWHRLNCRWGRHQIRGGHQMQLGSRFVHVERRCQWCDAEP